MIWRLFLIVSLGLTAPPVLAQTAPVTVPASRQNVSQLLRQGRELVRRGDLAAALELYQQVAELSPDNGAVFAAIGYIHTQQRNWPAALIAYQRAVTLSPKNADFFNALALVQAELGEYLEASGSYNRSLRLNARQVTAYLGLAATQERMGNPQASLATLGRGLVLNPKSVALHEALGRVWLKTNQPERALDTLTRAAQLAPRNTTIQRLIALSWALKGDTPRAKQLLLNALALNPRDAEIYFQLAKLQETTGDLPGAIRTYELAAQLQPARAYTTLGQLYIQQQNWAQAALAYRQVIELEPELAVAHHQLGLALHRQKKNLEAESVLLTARSLYQRQENATGLSQVEQLLNQVKPLPKSKIKPSKRPEPTEPVPYDGY